MSYSLGIDVGTTFTGAALAYSTHVEMLPLGDTALVVPSAVFVTRDGQLLTGEVAVRLAEAEPSRAVFEFKRRLGDPTPVVLGDRGYAPTELIAAVVRDAAAKARQVTGEDADGVVLTCPAIWGPYRLDQFTEVVALSGLRDCRVVTEPEAAAAFYLSSQPVTGNALMVIYDFGGGTFDAAVMRATTGHVELVGNAEGVDGSGGADLDQIVLGLVDEQLGSAISALAASTPAATAVLARLRADAIRAKEALSSDTAVVMPFFLPDGPHEVRLTRAEFERRIGPVLDPTIEAVWRALGSAGVEPAALDAILLSGGSSRVPLVTRRLEETFGRPVRTSGHPKHVVALGAAALARRDASERAAAAAAERPAGRTRPAVAGGVRAGSRRTVTAGAGWLRAGAARLRGPRVRRAALVLTVVVAAVIGLVGVALWPGADQFVGFMAEPSTSTSTSVVTPSPMASPVPGITGFVPGAACEPVGTQGWGAGYGSVGPYSDGGTADIRLGVQDGQEAWLVGQSQQLSRRSSRGNGYIRIGHAYLAMEADGDLILYHSPQHLAAGPACAAWHTGTGGHPGAYLRFQPDDNLIVFAPDGQPLWVANLCCGGAANTFAVRADGNLVLFDSSTKQVYWQSGTAIG